MPCANNNTQSPTCTPCGDGANFFDCYSGNAHRDITDLQLFGSIGKHPLAMVRYSSTRACPQAQGSGVFGRETVWTHSYQWYMRAGSPSNGQPTLAVGFPEGADVVFVQSVTDSTKWVAPANTGMSMTQSGTDFALLKTSGEIFHFKQRTKTGTTTIFYRIESSEDSVGNISSFQYNTLDDILVRKVLDASGRWLQFNYVTNNDLNQSSTTLGTIPYGQTPGRWYEIALTASTKSYRFLTLNYTNDWHNALPLPIAEMEFYDQNNVKITGTPFGSTPYAVAGLGEGNAFDGDASTYYQYAYQRNGYVGLDVGAGLTKRVSRIRYFVADATPGTLSSTAAFVGMTDASSAGSLLKAVTASDGRTVVYNYSTFTDPTGWFSWSTLTSVNYPDGANALYSYVQSAPYTRPLLAQALDPRYEGPGASISYEYVPDAVVGFLACEKNGLTGELICSTGFISDHNPYSLYASGRKISYTYNLLNANLAKRTDGLNHSISLTYDQAGAGFIATSTDARGNITNYTNDTMGGLLTKTLPDGTTETYTRDAQERVLTCTVTGPGIQPRTTTYKRDVHGLITRIDQPDGAFDLWTYNAFGQVLTHQCRNGGVETATYDAAAHLVSFKDALGNVTSYTYNAMDQVASLTDALNHTTSYAYNDRGQITQQTFADGSTQSFTYDDHGKLLATTNELGKTWSHTYDEYLRVLTSTDPLNHTTTYAYGGVVGGCSACNVQAKPTLITLPSGKQTLNVYDLEWNLTKQTTGYNTLDAAARTYSYDAVYNVTQVLSPRSKTTKYAYDNRNRVLTITDPLSHVTTYAYDGASNVVSLTRPDNSLTACTYDSMNRMMSTTDALNQITNFGYDASGNQTTITDARGNTHTYSYDLLNRQTQLLYPNGNSEQWTYDGVSNRLTSKTRAGQILTSTYDLRNRESNSVWSDATPAITRTFDAAGRLLSSSNGLATSNYTYDAANRQLSETQTPASLGQVFTVNYTYDADGNRASLGYPSGSVVNYTYTNRNQVSSVVADGPPPLATYTYNADGTRATKALDNGTVTTYGYDSGNQLLNVVHTKGATSLQRFDYA